jgi:hypothetical protein
VDSRTSSVAFSDPRISQWIPQLGRTGVLRDRAHRIALRFAERAVSSLGVEGVSPAKRASRAFVTSVAKLIVFGAQCEPKGSK